MRQHKCHEINYKTDKHIRDIHMARRMARGLGWAALQWWQLGAFPNSAASGGAGGLGIACATWAWLNQCVGLSWAAPQWYRWQKRGLLQSAPAGQAGAGSPGAECAEY